MEPNYIFSSTPFSSFRAHVSEMTKEVCFIQNTHVFVFFPVHLDYTRYEL